MNNGGDIFRKFCEFVDERIFSDKNVGTFVAFVVDQAFIDEFCNRYSINESSLMDSVRISLYSHRRDTLYVKGVLAIQLYAASKRANEGDITEKNYYDRLIQVLKWNIEDLRYWMKTYQEETWETLYNWCDKHSFQITKCKRRTGPGRYVQYPRNQALKVFTNEDLKYIAYCFIEKNILPNEDIQLKDFKRLIRQQDITRNIQTNHGHLVVENSNDENDYYNQVFNYFLRWDGTYKERFGKSKCVERDDAGLLFLYQSDDFHFQRLEFRTSSLSLKKKIDISSLLYNDIEKCYKFKREGVILFKRDDIYENYWQEVRYLEGNEEGVLILFNGCDYDYRYSYKLKNYLKYKTNYIRVYQISPDCNIRDFYTSKRFYELCGGLKVGRQAYLQGAAPFLKLERLEKIWIDDKEYQNESYIDLNYLPEGHHYIKIKDFKKIEIDIVSSNYKERVWMNDYNKWQINKKNNFWGNCECEQGSVGLDFSYIPQKKTAVDKPLLRRWGDLRVFGKFDNSESNIALNIIKQTEL